MSKKCFMSLAGSCAAFIFFLALAAGAHAQADYGQQQQQQMMQQPGADIEVTDAQLDKVAQAYLEITEIRQEFQEALAGVSDPEKAQEMQEQAGMEMVDAVENSGLDVQTYNQVMEAAQVDEQLREKLLTRLEQIQ